MNNGDVKRENDTEDTNISIQQQIRQIYADTSLSQSEKSKKVFSILNPNANANTNNESNNEKEDEEKEDEEKEEEIQACDHYDRQCMILAKCCNKWFNCRLCHDEQCDHKINRYETDTIRCNKCRTVQGISNRCTNCETTFGEWYCEICHIWTGNGPIFHCADCNVCRLGKQEDYFHCHTCNLDILKEHRENHVCQSYTTANCCPVCQEDIKKSIKSIMILPRCQHSMHIECFQGVLESGNYKCPQCKMSAIEDLSPLWNQISLAIDAQPLPPELRKTVTIFCNDCRKSSETDFHFLGNKCNECGGYNTNE